MSKICVSLADISYEKVMQNTNKYDCVELRMDKLVLNPDELKYIFSLDKEVISSHRLLPDKDEIIQKVNDCIKAECKIFDLDINIDKEYFEESVKLIYKNQAKLILSYHDYKKTPDINILKSIIKEMDDKFAHIKKIATYINNKRDLLKLTELSLLASNDDLITIGMGSKGVITRFNSYYLEQPYVYVCPDGENPTADGQMSYSDYVNVLNSIDDD